MSQPCIVTGNLQELTAGAIPVGKVRFQLSNIGTGNLPRIIGTGIFPKLLYQAETDPTGALTIPIWGNDNIDPANTIYLVTFSDVLGNQIGPIQFAIVGVSFNLNTAVPTNTILPPVLTSFGFATGPPLVAGNFGISGWGTGATFGLISGEQMGFYITVTAGTTPSVNPTVTLTFPISYLKAPLGLAQMVGGTGSTTDIPLVTTTTQMVLTYSGLPVATKTYQFAVFCLGLI